MSENCHEETHAPQQIASSFDNAAPITDILRYGAATFAKANSGHYLGELTRVLPWDVTWVPLSAATRSKAPSRP